jgi:hypothetical protein
MDLPERLLKTQPGILRTEQRGRRSHLPLKSSASAILAISRAPLTPICYIIGRIASAALAYSGVAG